MLNVFFLVVFVLWLVFMGIVMLYVKFVILLIYLSGVLVFMLYVSSVCYDVVVSRNLIVLFCFLVSSFWAKSMSVFDMMFMDLDNPYLYSFVSLMFFVILMTYVMVMYNNNGALRG